MTSIAPHLSLAELEQRYRAATAAIEKSHFHAIWLLAQGYEVAEVADLLAFSTRWVELLAQRYNEGGPSRLGDQRSKNGTEPTILTAEALAGLKERLARAPDDGGVWTAPKIAQWLARFHGRKHVHDQRGWEALIALEYTLQQPRPRHPAAAGAAARTALKKSSLRPYARSKAAIPRRRSRSGRRTSIASG
jgi:transposase